MAYVPVLSGNMKASPKKMMKPMAKMQTNSLSSPAKGMASKALRMGKKGS